LKSFELPPHLTESEMIGQGSSGIVYSALDLRRKEKVAVKVIPLAAKAGEKELEAVSKYRQLHHPDMVPVLEFAIEDDFFFYTMPLAGSTVAKCGKLSSDECRRMGVALLNALEALHDAGFLHRDVKPENILIHDDHYLLGDPGLLAPCVNASFAGTPGFIPPAVRNQEKCPDQAGDLYALGKVLYCTLTGNSVERFPEYSGDGSRDEAELMQLILDLCDRPEKYTISRLRKYLLHPGSFLNDRQEKKRTRLMVAITLLLVVISGTAIHLSVKKRQTETQTGKPAVQTTETAAREVKQDVHKTDTPQPEQPDKPEKLELPENQPDSEEIPPEVMKITVIRNIPVTNDDEIFMFDKKLQEYSDRRFRYVTEYRNAKKKFPSSERSKQMNIQYGKTAFYRFTELEKQAEILRSHYIYWKRRYLDYTTRLHQLEKLSKLKLKKDYSYIFTKHSPEELRLKQKEAQDKKDSFREKLLKNYRQQLELLQQP